MKSTSAAMAFPVTDWRLISALDRDESAVWEATSELCLRYWRPIYAFVRKRGYSPEDARDLTQGFFAQFLEDSQFAKADVGRGRLRTFLLTAATRFLSKSMAERRAWKRGGRHELRSLDALVEAGGGEVPLAAGATTPESAMDRVWAIGVLERAMGDLEQEMAARGHGDLFEALRDQLAGTDEGALPELAVRLGLSHAALRKALSRMRMRFRQQVREEIGRTVGSVDEIDAELETLKEALRAS